MNLFIQSALITGQSGLEVSLVYVETSIKVSAQMGELEMLGLMAPSLEASVLLLV